MGIGEEFIRKTCYAEMSQPPQALGQPQPPLELPAPEGAARVDLPNPGELRPPPVDFRSILEGRRSLRHYQPQALTLDELSYLLWLTQGVKEVTSRPSTLRPVPSAGARHAFETYLLANRVENLPTGLYRFLAGTHQLAELDTRPEITELLTAACDHKQPVRGGAAVFFWVAVQERMFYRYGERGYRYLLLDAGHICQNLYLAAESIGCGACAIGAFDDLALNAQLGLDGRSLFVTYLAAVGKR
jgi:SagB-type dehydrogenase family enzyme